MSPEAIQAAIARHAESETLFDQPFEDKKRVRVAGRFTVESLSPHRVLEESEADDALAADPEVVQFETMILDNLRTAGVQNTFKGERMEFDRLEPLAGRQWLQAEGDYEADGTRRRVAVSIGPEYGTVGSEQVALAAQEATRGIPYDVLLVTGFAFDPQAWAKAREINPNVAERSLGRLRVLLVRANPDLAMGGELLKKTGAGNLFSIFGEPDIDIRVTDGEVVVEIRGLDVYDPTSGAVRSASTEDIACWFIDTNYDGTSFFVRHAYFTGMLRSTRMLGRACTQRSPAPSLCRRRAALPSRSSTITGTKSFKPTKCSSKSCPWITGAPVQILAGRHQVGRPEGSLHRVNCFLPSTRSAS
jgi:adenine-specific DNA-methyltransferase